MKTSNLDAYGRRDFLQWFAMVRLLLHPLRPVRALIQIDLAQPKAFSHSETLSLHLLPGENERELRWEQYQVRVLCPLRSLIEPSPRFARNETRC